MHAGIWLIVILGLAAPGAAAATAPTPPATAAPTAGATEVTTAYGTIPPSLAGTWFVVLNANAGDRFINGWQVYRISRDGTTWQVNELHGTPTALLQQELAAANRQALAYTPSAAVLAATKDLLPSLKAPAPDHRALTVSLRARGHFAKGPAKDPRLDRAKLVLEFFTKSKNVTAAAQTYYFTAISRDRLTGEMSTASVSTGYGGTLVPISLAGPFTMYRIE
jgi:hypothetical protein